MLRTITVTPAAIAVLALAACGSGQDSGGKPGVAPETAKTQIERAAKIELASETIPDEAREQGLRASYSNAATAVKDGQVVGVFVMKDADVADEVSDMVRASAPKSSRLIVNDEVMVVYASAGTDRAAAVERAVEAL
jgi:hypothetical protein